MVRIVRTRGTERTDRQLLLARDIDRMSPEPFYLQLSRLVEEAIDAGEFEAGDRLPGESELCRRFDLARSTVRETLRTLQDRGRIKMVARRGAFVTSPGDTGWVLQVTAGFFEAEVDHLHRKVDTKVLEAKRMPFTGNPANALGLGPDDNGFLLRRVRRLDDQVALYSVNYLLPELEPIVRGSSIMQAGGSLNRALREAGYGVFGARRSVEAVPAPGDIAKLLEVPPNSPLLLVTSVSWGKDQRPFDYYTAWLRTDVVKVTVEASASIDDG
jgi:GntR family transcriptional regulator